MSVQRPSENRIFLKTSEFSCFFEPQTGFLRQVAVNGCEVIRAIYGAVRDQNWDTIQPKIVVSPISQSDDHFCLEFQVECSSAAIEFRWNGTIEGNVGTLFFKFAGEAISTFKKNRIGLCLLHPIRECIGKRCRVRDISNTWLESEFPLFISPHQPFKNLSAISWVPVADLEATVTFAGDVFETEDQRNWTDASFKTYCTPLEKPFPATIEAGTKVIQSITLELVRNGEPPTFASNPSQETVVVRREGETALPSLGVCANGSGKPLTEVEGSRLSALSLDHLRVDIRFDDPHWRQALDQGTADARSIGAHVQPALFFSGKEDLRALAGAVDRQALQVCLIFHRHESATADHWLEFASQLLPGAVIVGGTNAHFAELNRKRPAANFRVAISINPQVHAFDDLSLIENLEGQPETIQSARQFCTSGLYVSPITLRPRSDSNVTAPTFAPLDRLPSSVDIRQRTLFGAAWTVGSLARLLPLAGIESLTYYETTGWRGLMEDEKGNPLPDQFPSSPGEIFPVYHVFHALAGAQALFPVTNPHPQKLALIGFRKNGAMHVLLANLQPEMSFANLQLPTDRVAVQVLSEENIATIRQGRLPDPETLNLLRGELVLALPSYALAILRCI